MALLFVDSFDHYQTADLAMKWTSASGTISASYKRSGSQGILLNNVTGVKRTVAPATTDAGVMGTAIYFDANNGGYVEVGNTAGVQFRVLRATADGTLNIYRGAGSTGPLATSAGALALDTWYYLEVKWTLADSGGTIEVRVNGNDFVDYTGDTMQQAAATWTFVQVLAQNTSTVWLDDFYICDQDGSVNNNWLGDVTVECLFPQTDGAPDNAPGTHEDFTCSSGSDQGLMVNESSSDFPDEDSTYITSSTDTHRSTFNYPAITPVSADVLGVQVNICAKKSDIGTRTYTSAIRSGGTDYDGETELGQTEAPSDSSYAYGIFVHELDPDTSTAWTVGGVNAAEFGVLITE